MKPAVFLDRDGVLTIENGYAIKSFDEMSIFSYAADCVSRIKKLGFLTIVITNQSAVAKGLFSEEELIRMNDRLIKETGVDALYYCPHHPNGMVPRYTKVCDCRKPATGMIVRAQKDHEIDMDSSYMVGDRALDIILGNRAGIKTILVNSGYGIDNLEERCSPDHVFKDLRDVVNYLESIHEK